MMSTNMLNILHVSGFSGSGGLTYHNGRKFTTKDHDNDASSNNCAVAYVMPVQKVA